MLLGTLAGRCFEKSYRNIVQTDELRLEDDRLSRTGTDYRVFNVHSQPVFRINIKFHGTQFRKAVELVNLSPDDCFALATYKIHSATKKQEQEFLPYLFVVVNVPGLTGDLAHVAALYKWGHRYRVSGTLKVLLSSTWLTHLGERSHPPL